MKRTVSSNSNHIHLFRKYLSGDLEPELMHQLEKQAIDDPFMWEAMEGYDTVADPAHDLSLLQSSLHKRIAHLQEQKENFFFSWQRMSIAATASVMFIAAGILFWMNVNRSDAIRKNSERQVEVNLSSHEDIKSEIYSSFSSGSAIQPVIGWDKYQIYLKENLRKAEIEPGQKGSVFLSFKINKKGEAVDFVILKGLTPASNAEAIRLVKDGPAWKIRAGSKINTGRIEVRF